MRWRWPILVAAGLLATLSAAALRESHPASTRLDAAVADALGIPVTTDPWRTVAAEPPPPASASPGRAGP